MSICFAGRQSTVRSGPSYSFQFNEMARPARLELATLCLEDRQPGSCKSFDFKHAIENTNLSFMGEVWLDVGRCTGLIVGSLQKSLHLSAGKGIAA
jgi:hypothetical protein